MSSEPKVDHPVNRVVAGPDYSKLHEAACPNGDTMSLTLSQLAVVLKRRGIVEKTDKTLRHWANEGAKSRDGKTIVILRTHTLDGVKHSSVRWYHEFAKAQETATGEQ
jgi:hypothetical protein